MDIDAVLAEQITSSFGLEIRDPIELAGGEESAIWAVSAGSETFVVRIAPSWRSRAELEWVAGIQLGVSTHLSTVPAPIPTKEGTFTIAYLGHPVSIQERKAGSIAGNYDGAMRHAAAARLAEIHMVLDALPEPGPRPPSRKNDEISGMPVDLPDLCDTDLDRFERTLEGSSEPPHLIHGDYYRRNVLWHSNEISAVVDWDELAWEHQGQEIAWSAWEFCHNGPGTDLDDGSARDYVAAYSNAGGSMPASFGVTASQFIRRRLRWECRTAIADRVAGLPFDADYLDSEIEAFQRLEGRVL